MSTPTLREFARPPDGHKIYNLVGRATAEWARFEHQLDLIIWDLLDVSKSRGACVTAQMTGIYPRFEAILALITQRSGKKPELGKMRGDVNSLYNKARNEAYDRARIVHDPWYVEGSSGTTAQHRSMPKKEHVYGIKPKDETEIEDAIEAAKSLTESARRLTKKFSEKLHA